MTIQKKDARIFYNVAHNALKDFLVHDFSNPDEYKFLEKMYKFNIGNNLKEWDLWTLQDVLLHFFYNFNLPRHMHSQFFSELKKISEFKDDIMNAAIKQRS